MSEDVREIWRAVPSIPGVMASSLGRVMLAPFVSEHPQNGNRKQYGGTPITGYADGLRLVVRMKGRTLKIARLVCEAFNGPPPFDSAVCMHLDEDAHNNAPTNLAWGTQKENLNAPGFLAYCKSRTGENNPHIKGKKRKAA